MSKTNKASYSTDLRSRVVDYLKEGAQQKVTAQFFKVSRSTVSRWWLIYQASGEVKAKARGGSKGRIDPESLQRYVETHGDKRLVDISHHFGVSICSIYKRLKKLGYTYKKKPSPMWKLTLKREKTI